MITTELVAITEVFTNTATGLAVLWAAFAAWRFSNREQIGSARIEEATALLKRMHLYQSLIGRVSEHASGMVDIRNGVVLNPDDATTIEKQISIVQAAESANDGLTELQHEVFRIQAYFGYKPFVATLCSWQFAVQKLSEFTIAFQAQDSTDKAYYDLITARALFALHLGTFFADIATGRTTYSAVRRLETNWRLFSYAGRIPSMDYSPANFQFQPEEIRTGIHKEPHTLDSILGPHPPKQYKSQLNTTTPDTSSVTDE